MKDKQLGNQCIFCRVLCCTDQAIPPLFIKKLTKKDTVLGSSIQMECKVSGSLPIYAKWFKDGKEITDSAKYRSLCHENTMSLEIANLELTDTANYTCNVSNIAGSDSCSAVLTVKGLKLFDYFFFFRKALKSYSNIALLYLLMLKTWSPFSCCGSLTSYAFSASA